MNLRYPIGTFKHEEEITNEIIQQWIKEIESAPSQLKDAVSGLDESQLNTPYRPGGWTVRQVVHHIVDSHMNAYIRMKLALTEDVPTIKPYKEEAWAELEDSNLPIEVSLTLLESLHIRLVTMLRSLNQDQLNRTFNHPESGLISLSFCMGLYSWHGRHHIAHITSLAERLGWKE